MKYKAITSFSGVVSMASGDVAEIADVSVANDLLKAGYIIALESDDVTEKKPRKATKRKEKKTDGN